MIKWLYDNGFNEVVLALGGVVLSVRLGDTLCIILWSITYVLTVLAFVERIKK